MISIQELYTYYLKYPSISIDTRTLTKGDLFFALKGPNFNGNTYTQKALEKGAAYIIIDDEQYANIPNTLLVENVLETLQALSTHHRKQLDIPVIAIGGSNGKTTTKELAYAVLSTTYKCMATKGNLNNHIGVPLTLLSIPLDTEIAIVELGANHIGDNAELCTIAQPNMGLITNNGKDHLEGFGSIDGVIKANNEVYEHLRAVSGMAYVHSEDKQLVNASNDLKRMLYGKNAIDVKGIITKANPFIAINWKNRLISTQLTGNYNLPNILCAIALGVYFKVEETKIIEAIESYKPSNNRSQYKEINGCAFILDAYNANPSSMLLAIESLQEITASKKGVILGDMFELGKYSKQEHRCILEVLSKQDLAQVHLIGKQFMAFKKDYPFNFFKDTDAYLQALQNNLSLQGQLTLIKGSRGMKLEKILEVLQ